MSQDEKEEKHEIGGVPVCAEGKHDWQPVPTPHPSVTGQVFECSKCHHTTSVHPK